MDLIVCFDAISSPTRALQRQGRTGRHGDGRIIYLVTAGQEEDRFNKSAIAMKKLHAQLKEAEQFFTLNENAVRMLPREFGIPKMAHLVEDADEDTTGAEARRDRRDPRDQCDGCDGREGRRDVGKEAELGARCARLGGAR